MQLRRNLLILILLIGVFPLKSYSQKDTAAISFKLLLSAYNNSIDSAIYYLKQGADPNYRDDHGQTALFYAVQNNNLDMLKLLEFNGAKLNLRNYEGASPLSLAVWFGFFDVAEYLCYKGADPNNKERYAAEPLHFAAYFGYYYICDMLLFYKADVNAKTIDKNSPLHLAAINGDSSVISLLIKHKARPNVVNSVGYSPLDLAVMYNNYQAAKLLLDTLGASSDSTSNKPALLAANFADDSIVSLLTSRHFLSPFKKNNSKNPYNMALAARRYNAAKLLKPDFYSGILPFFSKVGFGVKLSFNKDDLFMENSLRISDAKYNLQFALAAGYRFKRKPVLKKISADEFYQLYERRTFIAAGMRKIFAFKGGSNIFSLFAGLDFQYHFGNYSGSDIKLQKPFALVPEAGALFSLNGVSVEISYSYRDYGLYGFSHNFFSVAAAYDLDLFTQHKKYLPEWL